MIDIGRCECGRRYAYITGELGKMFIYFYVAPCDDDVPVSIWTRIDMQPRGRYAVRRLTPFSIIRHKIGGRDGRMRWDMKLFEYMRLESPEDCVDGLAFDGVTAWSMQAYGDER
jgi:hypothetical protein